MAATETLERSIEPGWGLMQDTTGHTNEFDIYPEQVLGGLMLESEVVSSVSER